MDEVLESPSLLIMGPASAAGHDHHVRRCQSAPTRERQLTGRLLVYRYDLDRAQNLPFSSALKDFKWLLPGSYNIGVPGKAGRRIFGRPLPTPSPPFAADLGQIMTIDQTMSFTGFAVNIRI